MPDPRQEAWAVSENQRGELVLTEQAHQLTTGGGQTGTGIPGGPSAGSLFSGIGGMDHGLARAGFTHRFFCESDPWRREVLAHHWPGVPTYEDVRDVAVQDEGERGVYRAGGTPEPGQGDDRGNGWRQASAVDLLCGGFPCQDLSVAGQRRGLAGSRSSLFFEFARIIDALRPRWVLIENVPGLLSSNGGRDFGVVLGTLADLGYGVGWRVVDSRFFGVPQRRRRVFIVGARVVGDPRAAAERAGQVLAVGSRCDRHPATRGEAREDVAGTLSGGAGSRGWAQDTERMTFEAESVSATLGSPRGHDEQASYVVSDRNMAGRRREDDENLVTAFSHTQGLDAQPSSEAWPTLRVEGDGHAVGQGACVRRLTPRECERLQALPDDWTAHGPDSRRYAALGDAVTASVAEWIGRRIIAAEVPA